MNIGQLLGGAGVVGRNMRTAEEAERVSRQNQLAIEEQNRAADLKQQIAGLQMQSFQPVNVAQYTQQFTPGQAMPMGAAPTTPVPAAPAAAPAASAASAAPAANVGLGLRPMTPAEVARLKQDPYATGTVALAPEQVRQGYNRTALVKAPAALADLVQAPAAAGLNIISQGARGINYMFGTELPTPSFSMTPFTDRFVTAPEQELAAGVRTLPPKPAAAAEPTAPAQPTKRAQSYDNKVTPYDAIIQQSAVQYGLDPVVFKRLLGSESSFNPTAVSPRGEKFGLGIAQIAAVHNLTREQMLDPNTAIPFAAQLFSQYVQQAGGNVEEALMRYKGATSEKGRAAMSKPIGDIISGVIPTAQAAPAAAPGGPAAAPTAMEVPRTQARNMEMAEFYLANPESIPYELQQVNQMAQQQAALLTRQRNEAAQLAQVYMRSGTQQGIEAAMRLRENIGQFDASLLQIQQQVGQKQAYLQGMQGLRELATANDPRRLSGVLTQFMGAPVGIQPRPDGNYNYFLNGVKVRDNISPSQLASMALKEFSPEARQAASASAALENDLALKLKYDPQRDVARFRAAADIQKAIVDGEYKIAEERAKQLQGKLTIDTSKGVAYFQQGNRVFVITPDGKVEETPFGKVELPPTARPVAGLNMGR
jgi:soluble lytic murein transglycosylase-like protein